MTIENLTVLTYTAYFLVPGFIWRQLMERFCKLERLTTEGMFLQYLLLSIINYTFWLPAIRWFSLTTIGNTEPWNLVIEWGVVLLVSPLVLGAVSGLGARKDWLGWCLRKVRLNPIHPVPTAWDYAFSERPAGYVQVWLKDGGRVRGVYGGRSFASSDAGERDIYLEKTFGLGNDGAWVELCGSVSTLIREDEIRFVEFVKMDTGGQQ